MFGRRRAQDPQPPGIGLHPPDEELGMRVRKLEALLRISELAWKDDLPLDGLCRELADILQSTWRDPEAHGCRVAVGPLEIRSANYRDHGRRTSAEIRVGDAVAGVVEIGHLEEHPSEDDDTLVRAAATQLGRILGRRQDDEASRRSHASFEKAEQIAKLGYWDWDIRTNDLVWSDAVFRIYGMDPERDKPKYDVVAETLAPECRDRFLDALRRALEEDAPFDGEYRLIGLDGRERFTHTTGEVVRDAGGTPISMFGVVRDITARKRAEDELREKERLLSLTQEIAHVGSWTVDLGTGMGQMSDEGRRIFGVAPEYALTFEGIFRLLHSEDVPALNAWLAQGQAGQHPGELEFRIVRPDGAVRTVTGRGDVYPGALGGSPRLVGSVQDITERKEADEALRESEARFRGLFEQAGDYILVVDTHPDRPPTIVDANQAALVKHGYTRDEILGKPITFIDPAPPEVLAARAAEAEAGVPFEVTHRRRDGSTFIAEAVVRPVLIGGKRLFVSVERDVTERKRAEERLLTMQKLESLGTLAGGIAHDFNNLLTGILGGLSLLREGLAPESEQMAILQEAEGASQTARGLARQLLTFASGGKPVTRSEDLGPIVREAATFAARGSNVRCAFGGHAEPIFAEVDRDQLAQVVQNLVINAVQAMPMGGTVALDLDAVDESGGPAQGLRPGRYARLKVADEGVGIPDDVRTRIFDPYFSTKSRGRGLGLAVCHSIVARHGGRIAVEPRPTQGTTFVVHLPAAAPPAAAPDRAQRPDATLSGARILVMDDEPAVAKVLERILARLGAEADVPGDGAAALEAHRQASEAGRPYAAVIADLTVPGGMGGQEMARRLRAAAPGVRIIVSSGYSNDPVMADYQEHGFAGVLSKPYRLADVAALLGRILAP